MVKHSSLNALFTCKNVPPDTVSGKEGGLVSYLDFQGVSVIGAGCEVGVHFGSAAEGAVVGHLVLQAQAVPVAGAIGAAGHPTCERGSVRDPCTECPDMQLCTAAQGEVLKHTESETERILCGFDTSQDNYIQ